MKYEVIGWTCCGTRMYPEHKCITASVDGAIIKELRKHDYCFGGDKHEDYCPVLNDGTYVSYSWRGWGSVMAEARGEDAKNKYAYSLYYMDSLIDPSIINYPPDDIPDDTRIVPKETLAETFVMHLADEPFYAMKAGTKTVEIRLFDEKRKQVDIGDYIEFRRLNHEEERIKMRVVDLFVEPSFKEMFVQEVYKGNLEWAEELRFSPQSLGCPQRSTVRSLLLAMRKFYSKEQEKEHGVIAFVLEPPRHACRTQLKLWIESPEGHALYNERLCDPNLSDEETSRLLNEAFNSQKLEEALGELTKGFERHWLWFTFGLNENYNANVNLMLRKTLKGLFGKEETLKKIMDRFCVFASLEIFAVIAQDSKEIRQRLSLDSSIQEFLSRSGVRVHCEQHIV